MIPMIRKLLIIQLLTIIAVCQEQATLQTELIDTVAIEQKAKEDAKADFKKLKWIGKSFISGFGGIALAGIGGRMLLGTRRPSGIEVPLLVFVVLAPTVAINISDVNLPGHREKEVENQSSEYQSIYHSAYTAQIKTRRYLY